MVRKRVELPAPPAHLRGSKKIRYRENIENVLEGLAEGLGQESGGEPVNLRGLAIVATLLDDVTARSVNESRELGYSWAEIGLALGISKQAAQQRFGKIALGGGNATPAAVRNTTSAPKTSAERPNAALSLVNDVRLYLHALATAPEVVELSPAAKGHIITALQDAIDTVNDSGGEVLGADVGRLRAEGGG